MNELNKTLAFAGTAVVLALAAVLTAPKPVTPDEFLDLGEAFFPDFTDLNAATTLEVVDFDEETASAKPFKVTNQDGVWTIPSHFNYPADGKDRLAKTAAGIISLKKDDFRTSNVSDFEACGVIDPLDETTTSLKGRGKRVTIKGKGDKVLADLIIGKELKDRKGYHFVRLPDQKRVYVAKVDVDISTKFGDWIDKDLLKVSRTDINKIVIKDYSVNERTRSLEERDVITLNKNGTKWEMEDLPANKRLNTSKVSTLVSAIDHLSIVGVRPKPAGLSDRLEKLEDISDSDILSLQQKGYYFTRDNKLVSNEGELIVGTKKGITYTLRFGEIATGDNEGSKEAGGNNRYLFVSVNYSGDVNPEPPIPSNTDFEKKPEDQWNDEDKENKRLQDAHDKWLKEKQENEKLAKDLKERFGAWYYVISGDAFDKIHLNRQDLLLDKR